MAESALQAVNLAMRGGGYCSRANQSAKDVIDSAAPLVLDAISRLPHTDPATTFTFTDMGCADGGTALDIMRQVLAALLARWPHRPICVVYTDQPRNDFNSLFRIVYGLPRFRPTWTSVRTSTCSPRRRHSTNRFRPQARSTSGFRPTRCIGLVASPVISPITFIRWGPLGPSWRPSLSRADATGRQSSCNGRRSW
jgi:hypothetical protein